MGFGVWGFGVCGVGSVVCGFGFGGWTGAVDACGPRPAPHPRDEARCLSRTLMRNGFWCLSFGGRGLGLGV